jgi:2-amino-4-hydroxy-6-hydroxymethyldihydropteridine diphosphokinase
MNWRQAFVALGSNLAGDLDCPASQVLRGFQRISALPKTKLMRQSSLYQSAPVGYDAQPDFINAVVEISTQLSPQHLLDGLLEIEQLAGRERPFLNAPRVLDCDLLHYENTTLNSQKLTLPHPRMQARAFVLLPLAEIAPDFIIPNHGSVVELSQNCKNQAIKKHDF